MFDYPLEVFFFTNRKLGVQKLDPGSPPTSWAHPQLFLFLFATLLPSRSRTCAGNSTHWCPLSAKLWDNKSAGPSCRSPTLPRWSIPWTAAALGQLTKLTIENFDLLRWGLVRRKQMARMDPAESPPQLPFPIQPKHHHHPPASAAIFSGTNSTTASRPKRSGRTKWVEDPPRVKKNENELARRSIRRVFWPRLWVPEDLIE